MQTLGLYGIPLLSLILIMIGFNATEVVRDTSASEKVSMMDQHKAIGPIHIVTLGGLRLVVFGFSLWIIWPLLLP